MCLRAFQMKTSRRVKPEIWHQSGRDGRIWHSQGGVRERERRCPDGRRLFRFLKRELVGLVEGVLGTVNSQLLFLRCLPIAKPSKGLLAIFVMKVLRKPEGWNLHPNSNLHIFHTFTSTPRNRSDYRHQIQPTLVSSNFSNAWHLFFGRRARILQNNLWKSIPKQSIEFSSNMQKLNWIYIGFFFKTIIL